MDLIRIAQLYTLFAIQLRKLLDSDTSNITTLYLSKHNVVLLLKDYLIKLIGIYVV